MRLRALVLMSTAVLFAAPVNAQQGPPDGFADVPWGGDESGLVDEFGPNPKRDVHRLTWDGVLLLGQDTRVSAWVHPEVGLLRGVYAFEFTGMRNQAARFDACDEMLAKIEDILQGLYGPGSSDGESGCSDGYYASWDWGNVTLEIMTTYSTAAVGIGVMYRNHELENASAEADRRRF